MNSSLKIIALILSLSVAACSGKKEATDLESKKEKLKSLKTELTELKAQVKTLEQEIAAAENVGKPKELRNVSVQQLKVGEFQHFVEVQGSVDSRKNVAVHPEMNGTIERVNVEEGQRVKRGQTLMVIDSEVLQRNIDEVKTRLELAADLFERQANLWKQKIGSEVQYLQAKNNKESLERQLEGLKAQLNNAIVTAPISGTVDEVFVNAGEMANPAMPAVRVVNLSSVLVEASVSEAYVRDVRKGDTVEVYFPNIDLRLQRPVKAVGQFINPNNRTFEIQVDVPNPEGYLKPNMLAVVQINDFTQKEAVSVPSFVLQKNTKGETFVYIAKEGADGGTIAQKIFVETGMSYSGYTLVKSGLKGGDQLITKGYNEVIDGEQVNLVGPEA